MDRQQRNAVDNFGPVKTYIWEICFNLSDYNLQAMTAVDEQLVDFRERCWFHMNEGKSESTFPFLCVSVCVYVRVWMEVSGNKKSTWICLDIRPLFFHTVPKLVQAFVTMYSEIFQALATEEDVLLLKPLLEPDSDSVVRWKLQALTILFQFAKHLEVYCSEC
jgi:hypothetical protein